MIKVKFNHVFKNQKFVTFDGVDILTFEDGKEYYISEDYYNFILKGGNKATHSTHLNETINFELI